MMKKYSTILIIFLIVFLLFVFSLLNTFLIKNKVILSEDIYINEISKLIRQDNEDELSKLKYEDLIKDLNDIDTILNEQVTSDIDLKKKSLYYNIASNVYTNKINEFSRILNNRLDDEDFERLQIDIDEFNKNIDFATRDFYNKLESSVDADLYINKYIFEEKQKKCHEILETYKGFLS